MMKVSLTTFMHASNGITLTVHPETEVEKSLVKGFGAHGKIVCEDAELRIYWRFEKPAEEKPR